MLSIFKSNYYLKKSLCFLVMLCCFNSKAQIDSLYKAQLLLNTKQFDKATLIIDKVVLHPETKTDPDAWSMRSFAYSKIYKEYSLAGIYKMSLLDTAINSVMYAIKLGGDTNQNKKDNYTLIKNIAGYYYNLGTFFLRDSLNFSKSEDYYLKYKKYTLIVDPKFDSKKNDIKYYGAVGGMFAEQYVNNGFDLNNKSNSKYGDIAKLALLKVLELDSMNIEANITLGILFYNQGAALMRVMDYDIDIAQLDVIQENAKKLFKQSLPFMNKVYELDPEQSKALEGLEGIYHALLDEEKANEFKVKKEALNKK